MKQNCKTWQICEPLFDINQDWLRNLKVPVGKFAIFPELFLIATNIEGEEGGREGEDRQVNNQGWTGLFVFQCQEGPGLYLPPPREQVEPRQGPQDEGGHGHHGDSEDPLGWLRDSIPGT